MFPPKLTLSWKKYERIIFKKILSQHKYANIYRHNHSVAYIMRYVKNIPKLWGGGWASAQSLVQVGIFFKTGASVCSALKSVWWRRKNVFHFCYVGDLGQQRKNNIPDTISVHGCEENALTCTRYVCVCLVVERGWILVSRFSPHHDLSGKSTHNYHDESRPCLCVCARGKYTPATSAEYQSRNERWAVRSISWWLALGVFPREKNQSWHVFSACFPPSSESVSVSFGHGTQITMVGMGVENGKQNDWQFDKIALVLVLFGVYIARTGGEWNCSFAALEFRWWIQCRVWANHGGEYQAGYIKQLRVDELIRLLFSDNQRSKNFKKDKILYRTQNQPS